MGRWLQNFTTVDLKLGDAPDFGTIDAWLGWLEAECGIDMAHSSGTTGRMSLIARAAADAAGRHSRNRDGFVDVMGDHGLSEDELWYHIVWPGAAGGRSAQQKMAAGSQPILRILPSAGSRGWTLRMIPMPRWSGFSDLQSMSEAMAQRK